MFDSENDYARFEKKYPDMKEQSRVFVPTKNLAKFLLHGPLELLARVCLTGQEAPRVNKKPLHDFFSLLLLTWKLLLFVASYGGCKATQVQNAR